MEWYKEQRIKIERQVLHTLMRLESKTKSVILYNLDRGIDNRILTLSPSRASNITNVKFTVQAHKYSGLSERIHKEHSERNMIEKEVSNYIPLKGKFTYRIFNEDLCNYERCRIYCNKNGIPMITKRDFQKIKYLIKKWRLVSAKEHYNPTKGEKRFLKKLYNRSKIRRKYSTNRGQ